MIKQSLRGDIFAVAVCSSASFFFFPYFHLSTLPFPCLLFRAPPPSPSSPPPSFPTTNSFLLFFSPPSPHFHREEEAEEGREGRGRLRSFGKGRALLVPSLRPLLLFLPLCWCQKHLPG